jgi:serine/threonine protein phosphatase PrpC
LRLFALFHALGIVLLLVRALLHGRQPFVSHLPEIFDYDLNEDDKFLIIGCDGVWDVLNNQDAVFFVLNEMKTNYKYNMLTSTGKNNIAKKLALEAIRRGSTDNISVMILFFK